MRTVIYALIDPRTHEARYVGKTNVMPRIRFTSHLRDKRPSRKVNWIKTLRAAGLEPGMEILEALDENTEISDWQEAERFWISYMRSIGANLTNLTEGGEGLHGHIFTPEHRAKIGAAHKGRFVSQETRVRMAESRMHLSFDHLRRLAAEQKGKPLTPEHRAAIGKSWLGRKHTPETKAKIRAASLGRKCSAETRAKMSIVQKNRTPEHQEKLSATKRGKKLSAEHRARLSIAQTGRKHPPETIAKMREAYQRRKSVGS